MRGGINCPWVPSTVAAPFSQRLGDPGWGFPGQRFLRSAELLFSSAVGGLCHRLSPGPGGARSGGWRRDWGLARRKPLHPARQHPWDPSQQLRGSQGRWQGKSPVQSCRHPEPSSPTSAEESTMQKALAKKRSWVFFPSPTEGARRSAPALLRKRNTRWNAEPEAAAHHGTAAIPRPFGLSASSSSSPPCHFFLFS